MARRGASLWLPNFNHVLMELRGCGTVRLTMDGLSMNREQRLRREALSLWRALSSDPPPANLDGARLLDAAMGLKTPVDYDRLHSPHLRESQITRPK